MNYAASQVVANCDNGTYWVQSLAWYYENGARAEVALDQVPSQWRAINPDKIVD